MNKKIITLLNITLLIGTFYLWEKSRIDGIAGDLLGILLKTDTKYSDGYTDIGFKKIKNGMSEKEVIETLGEPLVRWKPYKKTKYKEKEHYVCFQYSESPNSTNYRLRQVHLENKIVVKVIAEFYLD